METRWPTRLSVLVFLTVLLVSMGGLVSPTVAAVEEPVSLKVALLPFLSFAPFFIAIEEGYFAKEGLGIEFVKFPVGGQEILSLAQGTIDVVAGAIKAAFIEAVARGINLKVVAGKGRTQRGVGYVALVVRRDLWEEGKLTTLSDLKGKRVAIGPAAGGSHYHLGLVLQKAGLSLEDVELVHLHQPIIVEALHTGAVDAAHLTEPLIGKAEDLGAVVRLANVGDELPVQQIGVISFGPTLLEKRPDLGRKFMLAYLKGVRLYNQGKISRNLEILKKYTKLDEELLKRCKWPVIDSEAKIVAQGIHARQDWLYEHGFLDTKMKMEDLIDTSFIEWASEKLSRE